MKKLIFGVLIHVVLFAASPVYADTPPLVISKSASPDPVVPGSNLTYLLVVTNTGQTDLSDVVVRDIIPVQTTFRSAGHYDGSWYIEMPCMGCTGTVRWTSLIPLPPGQRQRLQLIVKVDSSAWGTIVNEYFAGDPFGEVAGPPVAVAVDAPTPLGFTVDVAELFNYAGMIVWRLGGLLAFLLGTRLGFRVVGRLINAMRGR